MIEELCHKLKNKRKELGYSIEHIVNKTKLSPSVIKNIEEVN
ncbi:MAG: helix-turn-helix domain-containing protein, partial [Candidatus Omnitrophica bacterium]|nr:helix-turn-helix domain-containing protein [Candidatus Omnitrophota bacterium]